MGSQLTKCVLFLQAVFVISRGLFYSLGVSFDASTLHYYLQFIDPQLLQTRLLESIFYLHSQPPLFNLFLGVLLKCFPQHFIQCVSSVYLMFGQLFLFGLFALMVRLKVQPVVACICTAVFMVSPGVIMYENLLMYEYPAAVLIVWAAIWLHLFVERQKTFHGLMLFLTLFLLGMLKSIFHLFWMLLICVFVWQALRISLKKIFMIAGIPIILLASVYTKNLLLFGDFTLSYVVMTNNIHNMTFNMIPKEKVYEFYKEGKISPQTAIAVLNVGEYFSRNEVRRLVKVEMDNLKKTNVPLLDRQLNESSKRSSMHSMLTYLDHRKFMEDSIFLLKNDLFSYLVSIERVFFLYFFPGPTDCFIYYRESLSRYEDNFNFMFKRLNSLNEGQLYLKYLNKWNQIYSLKWDNLSWIWLSTTIMWYIFLLFYGIKRIIILMKIKPMFNQDSMVMIFIIYNIFFISLLSVLLSWWGTNRYRFNIESFYWVLFAILLSQILKQLPIPTSRRIIKPITS